MRPAFIPRAFTYLTAFALKYYVFVECYERCLQKTYARTETLRSAAEKSALLQDGGNVGIFQQQKVLLVIEKKKGAVLNSGTLFIELNGPKV